MDPKENIIKEYNKSATLGAGENKKEDDTSKPLAIKEINDNLTATNANLVSIKNEFVSINRTLNKQLGIKKKEAYQEEEKSMEVQAVPEEKQQATSVGEDVKSLAKNPAFGAAMLGLLYAFLPKDLQDTVKNGLKGFAEGLSEGIGPLSELSTEVKIAGGALATFLGSKVISSVLDAVTTVVKITKTLASAPGRLGKMSKLGKVAAAGAVGAVGIAAGKELMDDEEEGPTVPEAAAGAAPAAAGPASAGSAPSGGAPSGSQPVAAAEPVPEQKPIEKPKATAVQEPKKETTEPTQVPVTTTKPEGLATKTSTPSPAPSPIPSAAATPVSKPKATTIKPMESKPSKPELTESAAASTGTGITPGAKLGFKAGGTGGFKAVKEMIKMHEGVRNKPYKDSLGLWTVGVGHLIGDGKTLPPEWDRTFSNEEINALFEEDFEHHKKAAEKIPGYTDINEQGKGALIDLTFNMGPSWYKKWPNFIKQLQAGDYSGAASNLEDSKWFKQVGRRGPTIVSLIRAGGDGESGRSEGLSSGAAMVPGTAPQLEVVRPGKGTALAEMSEKVDSAPMVSSTTQVNNIDRSSAKKIGNKQADTPPPIPSPIASRGSLASYTSHATAYV